MPVLSVSYCHYRNLADETISLVSKEIFFVGENGQGKSNLLESIYCSAYGASFRTHTDAEIVRKGEGAFSVRTMYRDETGSTSSILVALENGKKRIEKNGKRVQDRKELVNTMPCVLFCHDDLDFVVGEPERRRFFIDQSLSMYDVLYIDVMRRYKRVLKSRNLSLKEHRYDMLDAYDVQLAQNGVEIERKRRDAIFQFNQIFGRQYEEITGIDGLAIRYEPSWGMKDNIIPRPDDVLAVLHEKRETDKLLGTTMSGPHRDRIRFVRNGANFIPEASTGQRRLIAILLRVAQALFYTQAVGKNPILLMDDVLLELDPDKRQSVTQHLPAYDQLFCTFLPGEPYERYRHSTTKVFTITGGGWHEA